MRERRQQQWRTKSTAVLATCSKYCGCGEQQTNAQETKDLARFIGLILLWVGLLWGLPRWNARKQFLKQPGAQGPRSVLFDGSGVHWRWNGGSSDIEWKNYVRSLEGKK